MKKIFSSLEVWNDDETMRVLFSPLPDQQTSPDSYEYRVKFWTSLLPRIFEVKNMCLVTKRALQEILKRKELIPLCLPKILEILESKQMLSYVNEFLQESVQIDENYSVLIESSQAFSNIDLTKKGIGSWFLENLVTKPTSWIGGLIFGGDEEENKQNEDSHSFVSNQVVKKKSQQFLETLYKHSDQGGTTVVDINIPIELVIGPMSLSFFNNNETKEKENEKKKEQEEEEEEEEEQEKLETILLCIGWLIQKHQLQVFENGEGLKIVKSSQLKFMKQKNRNISKINEIDFGILEMKKVQLKLMTQTEDIRNQIEEKRKLARDELKKKKNRSGAIRYLRIIKNLKQVLTKRERSADQISQILFKISQSESDNEVFNTFKVGLQTMKKVSKEYGLDPEKVDNVMIELGEVMADQAEIEDAIQDGIKENLSLSNEEEKQIELELDELISQQDLNKKQKSNKVENTNEIETLIKKTNSLVIEEKKETHLQEQEQEEGQEQELVKKLEQELENEFEIEKEKKQVQKKKKKKPQKQLQQVLN
ncbi:hypothetical protein M0813_20213 [Anaeramoeba flamelloides]|uniref:Charged multivesicular body protein 7 n=1 Tax=Anaeramoeba flamelloides TaxID=1746091 RepID=A0ABQ8YMH0_9EUKA|nr:hypothetical protein M0813_20213 [Anaeramoeba flamelloides]